jgi:hypothetical protein
MKIRPVGAELFHADRRTDMTKLIVAFRNFAKATKSESWRFISIADDPMTDGPADLYSITDI